eukprot:SRR837773.1533.p5 GENE.SRR837773.1533~~SRR837773.1533.p5  ORF type:complete len:111 (+),score=43.17 SRR837773.1533:404-736(+)
MVFTHQKSVDTSSKKPGKPPFRMDSKISSKLCESSLLWESCSLMRWSSAEKSSDSVPVSSVLCSNCEYRLTTLSCQIQRKVSKARMRQAFRASAQSGRHTGADKEGKKGN